MTIGEGGAHPSSIVLATVFNRQQLPGSPIPVPCLQRKYTSSLVLHGSILLHRLNCLHEQLRGRISAWSPFTHGRHSDAEQSRQMGAPGALYNLAYGHRRHTIEGKIIWK